MDALSATLLSVAFQLLLGTVLFTAAGAFPVRRRRPGWLRAGRELRRASPVALLVLALSVLMSPLHAESPTLTFLAAGSISTSGCYLIWRAGRLESRGRRRAARSLGRLAGGAILIGAAALVLLLVRSMPPASPSSLAAGLLLGMTGFAAVLAGLSAKPRPVGWLAIVLYLAAIGLLVRPPG